MSKAVRELPVDDIVVAFREPQPVADIGSLNAGAPPERLRKILIIFQ